jgi:hypothetical protein
MTLGGVKYFLAVVLDQGCFDIEQPFMSKVQQAVHLGLLLLLFEAGALFYGQNTGSDN